MARSLKSREESDGKSPGSLIFIGDRKVDSAKIRLIDYDSVSLTEKEIKDIHAASHLKTKPTVTWFNISGLHDLEMIQNMGKIFDLHPLIMEDLLNTGQRPKLEEFEDYIFSIETLGEKIEDLDDDVLNDPDSDVMKIINSFKREINYMRKSIRPAKDAILRISRLDSDQ